MHRASWVTWKAGTEVMSKQTDDDQARSEVHVIMQHSIGCHCDGQLSQYQFAEHVIYAGRRYCLP